MDTWTGIIPFANSYRYIQMGRKHIDFQLTTLDGTPLQFRIKFSYPQAKENHGIMDRLYEAIRGAGDSYITVTGERYAGRAQRWNQPEFVAKRIVIDGVTYQDMPAGS